jgi:iron complex transport system substrate-binding protein
MNWFKSNIYYLIIFLLPAACTSRQVAENMQHGNNPDIHYARGFTIQIFEDYTIMQVRHPQDTSQIIDQYYLYKSAEPPEALTGKSNCIQIPVQNIACLSTTHIGFLKALGLEQKLIAMTGTQWVYDPAVQRMIQENQVHELGQDGAVNKELLVQLQPAITMGYLSGIAGYDELEGLKNLGLQVIVNNEFMELHPLGMAEWLRFVAYFFDEVEAGDAYFHEIEDNYLRLKELVASSADKPVILTSFPFKGEWTVSGGQSFAAQYIRDAGGDYVWSDNTASGNFVVSLEEVLWKASMADIWINPGGAESVAAMLENEPRLQNFQSVTDKKVYNNNRRVNSNGGNDYWESAVVHPDWVLQDLIHIFHPDLSITDSFTYYQALK